MYNGKGAFHYKVFTYMKKKYQMGQSQKTRKRNKSMEDMDIRAIRHEY